MTRSAADEGCDREADAVEDKDLVVRRIENAFDNTFTVAVGSLNISFVISAMGSSVCGQLTMLTPKFGGDDFKTI